ncbi:MAG: hypothetical protein VCF25_26800 [Candidatus Poribacteria bacterium]|jgi:hypothetical protein
MAMCYLDIKWNARGVTTICGHGNLHIAQMGKELLPQVVMALFKSTPPTSMNCYKLPKAESPVN